jgi:hypothetical protein
LYKGSCKEGKVLLATRPVPKNVGKIKLKLVRKGTFARKLLPTFYLYDSKGEKLMLNSKRALWAKTGNSYAYYWINYT